MIKISIFTPTYNRKESLCDVYKSLQNQTSKDFEWIIVDDGSNDETGEIVKTWIDQGIIPIKYSYQDNAGKHVAQNRALDQASGELFLPLDSDDTIVPECIQTLWDAWISIPDTDRTSYSGVGCLCMDKHGHLIGDAWPKDRMVSNDLDIVFRYKVKGEKWGPIRTDVMRQYKNEEVKGHYLPESTCWFRIANKYKKLYINETLRIYEIREDSVQKKGSFVDKDNAEAKMVAGKIYINEFWEWYKKYNLKGGVYPELNFS